jgi:hypothetical protein
MFGGLDICGLDVVKLKSGEEVVLEINGVLFVFFLTILFLDTAIGICPLHEDEDRKAIRELVIERMNEKLCQ